MKDKLMAEPKVKQSDSWSVKMKDQTREGRLAIKLVIYLDKMRVNWLVEMMDLAKVVEKVPTMDLMKVGMKGIVLVLRMGNWLAEKKAIYLG